MTKRTLWWESLAVMAMLVGCSGAPDSEAGNSAPEAARDQSALSPDKDSRGHHPSRPVFELDSRPYGVSMLEWAYSWMRWEYSVPAATNPNAVDGVSYDQHQFGPVFFAPVGPNHNDAFTVSRHKAVAIMLSQISNDFPCPDPTFKPAPGQSLYDFLMSGIAGVNDAITVMTVTLDGVPLENPLSYRLVSPHLFYFIGDSSLAASFDSCVTGHFQPAVVDDVFIILKPLERGQHVLVTHIENSAGHVFDRTRTITAE